MRQALLVAAGGFLLAAPVGFSDPGAKEGIDAPPVRVGAIPTRISAQLRVMSYNVKGLPWPIATGRSADLAAIGDRLKAMRARGEAPQVVVLQEAFSSDARTIAARAGYAHVAYGPEREEVVPGDPTKPMPERYRWRGEGFGPYLSSGLVLMSDYPIANSRRIAFPRTACAGYDCLANKGVLLVRIRVPGLTTPVEIMTAHMNSRLSTYTPIAHANEAYAREMAAIDNFVAANADPSLPMIFGGDLNLDFDPQRLSVLQRSSARWRKIQGDAGVTAISAVCAMPWQPCHPRIGLASLVQNRRNNDWQLSFTSRRVAVQPVAAAIRFMPDSAGRALSDHQAVMVTYRLSSLPSPIPTKAATALAPKASITAQRSRSRAV